MSKALIFIYLSVMLFSAGSFSQGVEMSYSDIDIECSFRTDSNKFIIRNRTEFFRLTNCSFVGIDFERYSIIGVNGYIGGCKVPVVEYRIIKDVNKRQYFIEAIVYQFGSCKRGNPYRRTVYVDKLEEDYKIHFVIRNVNISG
jgi:hypothetical protein